MKQQFYSWYQPRKTKSHVLKNNNKKNMHCYYIGIMNYM